MNLLGPSTKLEIYANNLGGLWARLQSLDIMLRLFLHGLPGASKLNLPAGTGIFSLQVGDEVTDTALTRRDFFSDLVKAYNQEVTARSLGVLIKEDLVELRNALAHGMVTADKPDGEFRIVHFKKARGVYRITCNDAMNQDWFDRHRIAIEVAFRAVSAAVYRLPPQSHKP